MLSRFLTMLNIKPRKKVIDIQDQLNDEKKLTTEFTQEVTERSVRRSAIAKREFEQTGKKVYDVAEKIYIVTGQHR